ncbi:MAG: ATP-binding cassette domain-containing protein [Candidatus Marinimicrobia bacterium]|nr:ATP-binding cassette domain-containing protein [Candidatus Neomarinimicrobiota bacterium]
MSEQTPLLQLENIKVKKPHQPIEIYTSTLFSGLIYQIQGPNGSGKTSLLEVFAHEQKINEGTIYFEGKSGAKKQYSTKIVKGLITYISQEGLKFKKTPLATLLDAVKAKRLSSPLAYRTVMELLDDFALQDIANRKMTELSSGTRKKIALLSVFLQDSKLIIIDDPCFDSLDDYFVKKYVTLLKKNVKQDKRTLVLASAQSLVRHRLVDITLVMHKGHIIRVEKTYQRKSATHKKPIKKS